MASQTGAREPTTRRTKPAARLVAVDAAGPRECPLTARDTTAGSAPDNNLVIEHESVSRHHARVTRTLAGIRVVDLESTNGTLVNGRRIRGAVKLRNGDEVRFGSVRFAFILGPRITPPAPLGVRVGFGTVLGGLVLLFLVGFIVARRADRWWNARSAVEPTTVVASPAVAPSVATADHHLPPSPPAVEAPAPPWLVRLNYYRGLGKLPPAVEDPALSRGDVAHCEYLVRNFGDRIRRASLGAEAHVEDPKLPWFTNAGATAGRQSVVNEWFVPPGGSLPDESEPTDLAAPVGSPAWSVDGWMAIPFHRLPLLNPKLRLVGYGDYCDGGVCASAMFVGGPGDRGLFPAVQFPPDGSTIALRESGSEWPDPRASCPGYEPPNGLAITMQTGYFVNARLGAFALTRIDGTPAPVAACGFDEASYRNVSPADQQVVSDVLHEWGAVEMLPRSALVRGARYQVAMTVNDKPYQWTFAIGK